MRGSAAWTRCARSPGRQPVVDDPNFGIAGRTAPANLVAEQALLGALLANSRAFDACAEFLEAHHFADPVHAAIYAAIARRINAGQVADAVSLRLDFQNTDLLDPVGGIGYLAQLLACMVGIVTARDYARAVHDAWVRRETIAVLAEGCDAAFGAEVGGLEVLEGIEAGLLRVADGAGSTRPTVSAGLATLQAVAKAREAAQRGTGLVGMTTGLAALDRMSKGLVRGQYVVIGARPSMGKTSLGLTIAARCAAAGHRGLYWTGEMAADQLGVRLAAAHAGLSTSSVLAGMGYDVAGEDADEVARPMEDGEWSALDRAVTASRALPLEIDDRPGMTVAGLRSRARRMKRKGGLDFIVVDYVGLMRPSQAMRGRGRYEATTEISGDLLALARELDVALVALVQLNRANESRDEKKPQMSDLRDSGAIEQDANVIMFLHREHYYLTRLGAPTRKANEREEDYADRVSDWVRRRDSVRGVAEIGLSKNRQGPTGNTRLRYAARSTWFRDESEGFDDPAWGTRLGGNGGV